MPATLPPISRLYKGEATECEFFDQVQAITALLNQVRESVNAAETEIDDLETAIGNIPAAGVYGVETQRAFDTIMVNWANNNSNNPGSETFIAQTTVAMVNNLLDAHDAGNSSATTTLTRLKNTLATL